MDTTESPNELPDLLKAEAETVKLIYLWLKPQGIVDYSVRDIEGILDLSHEAVRNALSRLRAAGYIEDLEPRRERKRNKYRAKT